MSGFSVFVQPPLDAGSILARLNGLGAAGAAFTDSVFAIAGSGDATKKAVFEVDGFTASTTRTFTLPNATGTLAILSLAQTFSALQTFSSGIDSTSIGATTRGTGLFTTLGANGAVSFTSTLAVTALSTLTGGLTTPAQITSTIATGTAPLVIASTTNVPNLNASSLSGATFAAPGAIGSGTPSTGAFTTLSASGVITSTLSTGTAPFTVASTTVVGNLNVSQLLGSTWAAPGTIGSGTPSTGAFTTLSATGVITSTLATGTAPFTVASTTNVANLNASSLSGATFASPGAIGGGTPSTGAFTTLSATGVITSTLATGTAPFTVASTTVVANLNASSLSGATFAAPGAIGSTTASTALFTTLGASGVASFTNTTEASAIGTASVVLSGGLTSAKKILATGNIATSGTMIAGALAVASGTAGFYLKQGTNTAQEYGIRFVHAGSDADYFQVGYDVNTALGTEANTLAFYSTQLSGYAFAVGRNGKCSSASSFIVGTNAAIATNATDGFLYLPSCAGAPSGTPTAITGKIPTVYDSTNNFLYVYNGGWKKSTVYA